MNNGELFIKGENENEWIESELTARDFGIKDDAAELYCDGD